MSRYQNKNNHTCLHCHKPYEKRAWNHEFCSAKCREKHDWKKYVKDQRNLMENRNAIIESLPPYLQDILESESQEHKAYAPDKLEIFH